MNPEEREAILKILKIITAKQEQQVTEILKLLREISEKLDTANSNLDYLARTYVAPS